MKTVVITGTTRGIGRAIADKFLENDFRVIGTSTSGKSDISNPNFEILKLDLSNSDSIIEATDLIKEKAPQIDILINNAGINLEDWDEVNIDIGNLRKTLEVNLIGLIDFTERLLSQISPDGQIVNISSRMGSLSEDFTDNPADCPTYRISKTALNMYTKTLASRLRKQGITVSSVHPGWVKTDMGGEDAPREPQEAAEQIFKLATTLHPTGKFWYDFKEFPW
jgi:NAD(P)-dependent dehydrogenase (short-subunit alcohol dehydrogenase family)